MRTRIIFTLCWVTCFFLTSCGKINCPAFPEHLVDYLPYKTGDTLSFVNQNNDTISFRVNLVHKDREYTAEKCGKCGGCDNPFYRIATSTFAIYVVIAKKSYIRIEISGFYWDGVAKSSKSSILYTYDETGKDPFDYKNSALFGESVILDILEDNNQPISRATIVKGKGITEFYDRKNNFQWKSINN